MQEQTQWELFPLHKLLKVETPSRVKQYVDFRAGVGNPFSLLHSFFFHCIACCWEEQIAPASGQHPLLVGFSALPTECFSVALFLKYTPPTRLNVDQIWLVYSCPKLHTEPHHLQPALLKH